MIVKSPNKKKNDHSIPNSIKKAAIDAIVEKESIILNLKNQ